MKKFLTLGIVSSLSVCGFMTLADARAPATPATNRSSSSVASSKKPCVNTLMCIKGTTFTCINGKPHCVPLKGSSSRSSDARKSSSSLKNTVTARTITITAERFKFTPSIIRIKKGQKITLLLKGISGMHGFGIPALSINESIPEGTTQSVSLPTDTVGTFDFLCTMPCGSGHQSMKGQIIIEN